MFKTKLNHKNGFTMVELMVAVALIGVLAMAIVNQMQLVNTSKRDSAESLITNRLVDQISVEMSHQETCSKPANFGNLVTTAAKTRIPNLSLVDAGGTKIIEIGKKYGMLNGLVVSDPAGSMQSIQIDEITTQTDPTNNDQLILEITFAKKTGIGTSLSFLRGAKKVQLPLTIVRSTVTPANVAFCYSDITNSIASAIRLSCQGNNSYYDPAANMPYGACKHNVDTTICPAGQYIQKAEIDASVASPTNSGKLKFTCGPLPTCPTGKVIKSIALDGQITCDFPLPNCSAGQLMYKTPAGPYTCMNVNNCTGAKAIKRIDSTGVPTCEFFFPPNTCGSGRATAYDPSTGAITCAPETFRAVTCNPGYYISSFDSTGTAQCSKYITASFNCPAGTGATGVDGSGNLTCQTLQRQWCNGTPRTHMNSDCSGSIVNAGPNQVCKVAGSTCPAGWSRCMNWGETTAANRGSCTDTNSACTLPMGTYYTGTVGFNPSWNAPTVTCTYYYDIPNDGVPGASSTCGTSTGNSGSGTLTSVGCY